MVHEDGLFYTNNRQHRLQSVGGFGRCGYEITTRDAHGEYQRDRSLPASFEFCEMYDLLATLDTPDKVTA